MEHDEQAPLLPNVNETPKEVIPATGTDPFQLPSTSKAEAKFLKVLNENGVDAKGTAPAADTASNNKKKAPPFLQREVKIKNPAEVDQKMLLQKLHTRFEVAYARWRSRTGVFKLANLVVTLILVLVQVVQVLLFQLPFIPEDTMMSIATILPAFTGAVLAIQLKLGWGEKAQKCKKSARMCKQLSNHAQYRLDMAEAGGEFDDSVKVWNTALIAESTEIPAFLFAY